MRRVLSLAEIYLLSEPPSLSKKNYGFVCRSELNSDLDSEQFKHYSVNFFETSSSLILK